MTILLWAGILAATALVDSPQAVAQPDDSVSGKRQLDQNGTNELTAWEVGNEVAAQRPSLSHQERQFLRVPRLTPEVLQQYDTNHNGKLDHSEHMRWQQATIEAAKAEFRRFDTDNNGTLDEQETKAAREAGWGGQRGRWDTSRGPFGIGATNELPDFTKSLTPEELARRQAEADQRQKALLEKYDRDHSGGLSASERAAALAEMRRHQASAATNSAPAAQE